jgi:hypothetical protein
MVKTGAMKAKELLEQLPFGELLTTGSLLKHLNISPSCSREYMLCHPMLQGFAFLYTPKSRVWGNADSIIAVKDGFTANFTVNGKDFDAHFQLGPYSIKEYLAVSLEKLPFGELLTTRQLCARGNFGQTETDRLAVYFAKNCFSFSERKRVWGSKKTIAAAREGRVRANAPFRRSPEYLADSLERLPFGLILTTHQLCARMNLSWSTVDRYAYYLAENWVLLGCNRAWASKKTIAAVRERTAA